MLSEQPQLADESDAPDATTEDWIMQYLAWDRQRQRQVLLKRLNEGRQGLVARAVAEDLARQHRQAAEHDSRDRLTPEQWDSFALGVAVSVIVGFILFA